MKRVWKNRVSDESNKHCSYDELSGFSSTGSRYGFKVSGWSACLLPLCLLNRNRVAPHCSCCSGRKNNTYYPTCIDRNLVLPSLLIFDGHKYCNSLIPAAYEPISNEDSNSRKKFQKRTLFIKWFENTFFYLENFTFRTSPGVRNIFPCCTRRYSVLWITFQWIIDIMAFETHMANHFH